jgi:hypothetical protein
VNEQSGFNPNVFFIEQPARVGVARCFLHEVDAPIDL